MSFHGRQSRILVCCAPHLLMDCREHAANEVFVTGTFDNWQKTIKLEKVDGVFKKIVELPKAYTQYKVRLSATT